MNGAYGVGDVSVRRRAAEGWNDEDDQLCAPEAKIEDPLWTYTIAANAAMTQTLGSLSVSIILKSNME